MTGATIEFDHQEALASIQHKIDTFAAPAPLFRDIGEYLLIAHHQRFNDQKSPAGEKWQALSPRYKARKKKNKDKILRLDGRLANDLRYQVSDTELLFGSNKPYAAIHHFGGEIPIAARSQQAYFKRAKNGEVKNRFVKKSQSNFAEWVTIKSYVIKIPARPWLGVSDDDANEIIAITQRHFSRIMGN